jgi:5-methylcytosine-specific restriction enzyme A
MPQRVPTYKSPYQAMRSACTVRLAQRNYDQRSRDPEAKRFYNSGAWQRARLYKLQSDPLCEHCLDQSLLVAATLVHHKIEVRQSEAKRLDLTNMVSLCAACHARVHS